MCERVAHPPKIPVEVKKVIACGGLPCLKERTLEENNSKKPKEDDGQ